jgi:hypothetical protein
MRQDRRHAPTDGELESDSKQRLLGTSIPWHHHERQIKKPNSTLHAGIISLEFILGVLLLVGFFLLNDKRHRATTSDSSLDGLLSLNTYNTTLEFRNQSELLRISDEANNYWRDLLSSGGVVSLNTQWALDQGLKQSATSPTDSEQSIYQVDVFHALHCLVPLPCMHELSMNIRVG